MAGRVIQLLKRSFYDMSGLAAGSGSAVIVATRIDVSDYTEATLQARLHPGSTMPADASITFYVFADGYTDQDPAPAVSVPGKPPFFLGENPLATATLLGTAVPLAYTIAAVPAGFGGLLLAGVQFVQGATPATFAVTLSMDLSVKCPPRGAARWPRAPRDGGMMSNADRAAFIRATRMLQSE